MLLCLMLFMFRLCYDIFCYIFINIFILCSCRGLGLRGVKNRGNSNEPHSPRVLAALKKELEDSIYTFQARSRCGLNRIRYTLM